LLVISNQLSLTQLTQKEETKIMTLTQLKRKATALNLIITKSKGIYHLAENIESNFIHQFSSFKLADIEKQIKFYSINGRFSNNRFTRDLVTGAIVERHF
jgi:hypothetical protein